MVVHHRVPDPTKAIAVATDGDIVLNRLGEDRRSEDLDMALPAMKKLRPLSWVVWLS